MGKKFLALTLHDAADHAGHTVRFIHGDDYARAMP